jgi:hypothetical protein
VGLANTFFDLFTYSAGIQTTGVIVIYPNNA